MAMKTATFLASTNKKKNNNIFTKLPEIIIESEIFPYLEENDQLEWVGITQSFYHRYYRGKLRQLTLKHFSTLIYYLLFEEFRNKLTSLIAIPWKQLNIHGLIHHNRNDWILFHQILSIASNVSCHGPWKIASPSLISFYKKNFPSLPTSLPQLLKHLPPPLFFSHTAASLLLSSDIQFPSLNSLQFHQLEVSDAIFYHYFLSKLKKLSFLHLYRDPFSISYLQPILQYLIQNAILLKLKQLFLSEFRKLTELPYIPGIEILQLEQLDELIAIHSSYFLPPTSCSSSSSLPCYGTTTASATSSSPSPSSSVSYKGSNQIKYQPLKKLTVSNCVSLANVALFDQVKEVILSSCPEIVNIHHLQRNNSITIESCHRITNYRNCFRFSSHIILHTLSSEILLSDFEHVHTLEIHFYQLWLNFPSILPSSLKILLLKYCSFANCKDIQTHSLQKIIIENCSRMDSLQGLAGIPTVKLVNLRWITSLVELGKGGTKAVMISGCNGIVDFSPLRSVTSSVWIHSCDNFKVAAQLDTIPKVSIINCRQIESLQGLSRVQELEWIPPATMRTSSLQIYHEIKKIPTIMIPFQISFFEFWATNQLRNHRIVLQMVKGDIINWEEIQNWWNYGDGARHQRFYEIVYHKRIQSIIITSKKT